MSFASEASKLLTNKYFLYFMVFLAATNVLGYLVTNKMNAVIFFALVSLLTYQFSKNMAVVLLVSVITTNFLMANKRMREGLENKTTENAPALNKIEDKDQEIAAALPAVQQAKNNEEVSLPINKSKNNSGEPTPIVDTNNADLNKSNETGPQGFGDKMGGKKSSKTSSTDSRIDYATTINQSYENLDTLLGSENINKLSKDTMQLMSQQQKLFDTMQNMVPVLQGAQNLLKDFKIDGLAESLKSIGGVANMPLPGTNK